MKEQKLIWNLSISIDEKGEFSFENILNTKCFNEYVLVLGYLKMITDDFSFYVNTKSKKITLEKENNE